MLGSAIAAGLAILLLVSLGYYPIMLVNARFVSARTFRKNYAAESKLYQNFLKTSKSNDQAPLASGDIARSALTRLVENRLIDEEARNELGEDLASMVREKIKLADGNPQIEKGAQVLYGLDLADFKDEILVPQAERDILTGRLFLKGIKIDDWLRDAKKSSRVVIFSGEFRWNGEEAVSDK